MKTGIKAGVALCIALLTAACGGSDNEQTPLQGLSFTATQYNIAVGGTVQPPLTAKIGGSTSDYDLEKNPYGVVWSTADARIATVSANGTVTGIAIGSTILTAKTAAYTTTTAIKVAEGWIGEWKLTEWKGSAAIDGKVFLELTTDGKFNLYQNINNLGYEAFSGTYSVADGNRLTGVYADGTALADSYTFLIDSDILTLTAQTTGDLSRYARTTIPDAVKDGVTATAAPAQLKRAKSEHPFL